MPTPSATRRRPRQSGARVRRHAAQRRVLVRRRAGGPARRHAGPRGQVPRRRREGGPPTCGWLKPATYMNLSGAPSPPWRGSTRSSRPRSWSSMTNSTCRPARSSSSSAAAPAGHNGLKDIRAQLGTRGLLATAARHRPPARLRRSAAGRRRLRAAARRAPTSGARSRARWTARSTPGPTLAAGDYEQAMLDLHTESEDQ